MIKNIITNYLLSILLGASLTACGFMFYLYRDTKSDLEVAKDLWAQERQKRKEYEIKKIEDIKIEIPTDSVAFRILGWELSDRLNGK